MMTKKNKEILLKIRALRVRQREEIIAGIIKPLNDNIRLCDKTLKGEYSLEGFDRNCQSLNKHLLGLFK